MSRKIEKRKKRAKDRAKTMRLRRQKVPCTASRYGWQGADYMGREMGLTPGEVDSARKKANYQE